MILITGANGVVGEPLTEALKKAGAEFKSVSRSPVGDQIAWDLTQAPSEQVVRELQTCRQLIHCAPIWLLAPHIEVLREAGIERLVVFSSTSVVSKQASVNVAEQALVRNLASAEQTIKTHCVEQGVTYTVLRPSLIYGHRRDQNITHIARFIKKWGFVVLVGDATGRRQPVHADDLAAAAVECLNNQNVVNQVYNVAGAEVLTYRNMILAIFDGLNRKARVLKAPLWLVRLILTCLKFSGRFDYTPEMADRMNQDLVYSNQAATEAFGFSPERFLEQPQRDLP